MNIVQNKISNSNPYCPLCGSHSNNFYKSVFFLCNECKGIFRPESDLPSYDNEKNRYKLHNNDISDENYISFLSPIIDTVKAEQSKDSLGLDFGAGPTPVITQLLKSSGYNVEGYDPFFNNRKGLLGHNYDYIICSEVVEHFHNPDESFVQLKQLLKPRGCLYIMTLLYEEKIDFAKWHYKNDFTHTFFYQKMTFEWIKKKYGFSNLRFNNRMIKLELY